MTAATLGPLARRAWLPACGLVLLSAVGADTAPRVYRVGLLFSTNAAAASHIVAAFIEAMGEHGWSEGKNLVIERRWAESKAERFPDLALDLVRQKVDVIVASSQAGALAAKRATPSIPIVMVNAADPIEAGLVTSLAQPGGNVTGLTAQLTPAIRAKSLQLITEALPGISRVTVLRPADTAKSPTWTEYETAAQVLRLRVQFQNVRDAADLAPAFAAIAHERPGALLIPGGEPIFFLLRQDIVGLAREHRLPTFYSQREFTEAGGLMSYSARLTDQFRRAATYVDKILKGASPATLPVESPTQFELIVNIKTAKALGLQIPRSLLVRADEVIE